MSAHYSFPRTPHLAGSTVSDDDRVLTDAAFQSMAKDHHLVVQEKVDGTNVGIHFDAPGLISLQKRSGPLATGEHAQYNAFRSWAFERLDVLYELVGAKYVLFGEWLWAEHGMHYDALPDFFLAFDLMVKESGEFLVTDEIVRQCGNMIHLVPILWRGTFQDMPALLELVAHSHFSPQPAEGVYIRVENRNRVIGRCKWRRPGFKCGRNDFASSLRRNALRHS